MLIFCEHAWTPTLWILVTHLNVHLNLTQWKHKFYFVVFFSTQIYWVFRTTSDCGFALPPYSIFFVISLSNVGIALFLLGQTDQALATSSPDENLVDRLFNHHLKVLFIDNVDFITISIYESWENTKNGKYQSNSKLLDNKLWESTKG